MDPSQPQMLQRHHRQGVPLIRCSLPSGTQRRSRTRPRCGALGCGVPRPSRAIATTPTGSPARGGRTVRVRGILRFKASGGASALPLPAGDDALRGTGWQHILRPMSGCVCHRFALGSGGGCDACGVWQQRPPAGSGARPGTEPETLCTATGRLAAALSARHRRPCSAAAAASAAEWPADEPGRRLRRQQSRRRGRQQRRRGRRGHRLNSPGSRSRAAAVTSTATGPRPAAAAAAEPCR